MLAPSMARVLTHWSIQRPRQTAEAMPQGTPISMARLTEKIASQAVGSARSSNTCVTGICKKIDCPRLPLSTSPSHSTNCASRGWSSP